MGIVFKDLDQKNIAYRMLAINSDNNYRLVGLKDRITNKGNNDWFAKYKNDSAKKFFVIEYHSKPCGLIGLKNIDYHLKSAELFIVLDSEFKNIGIETKSINKLAVYAKDVLHLDNLYLTVIADNKKAIDLYTKLGFKVIKNNSQNELEMVLDI